MLYAVESHYACRVGVLQNDDAVTDYGVVWNASVKHMPAQGSGGPRRVMPTRIDPEAAQGLRGSGFGTFGSGPLDWEAMTRVSFADGANPFAPSVGDESKTGSKTSGTRPPTPSAKATAAAADATTGTDATSAAPGGEPSTSGTAPDAGADGAAVGDAPAAGGDDAAAEGEATQWACGSCTFLNPMAQLRCSMCGGYKPGAEGTTSRAAVEARLRRELFGRPFFPV